MALMLLPGPLLLPVGLEGRGEVSGSCRPSALEAAARRLRCILIRSNSSALKSARISIVLTSPSSSSPKTGVAARSKPGLTPLLESVFIMSSGDAVQLGLSLAGGDAVGGEVDEAELAGDLLPSEEGDLRPFEAAGDLLPSLSPIRAGGAAEREGGPWPLAPGPRRAETDPEDDPALVGPGWVPAPP